MKISAVIIACNEESKIGNAVRSVLWADEILVVDSGSTDRTVDIARELGAKVVFNEWQGFSRQKQFATDLAENDLILSLDADEQVTEALRDEIRSLINAGLSEEGFTVPRLSVYMGREIRHGGWYPDRQLRFFDRRKGRWSQVLIHESFQLSNSKPAELSNDLLHFSVDGPEHHHRMIGERYAPLAARQAFENGRRTSFFRIATAAPAAFIRSYFLKLGFLDGIAGYAIARFAAHHAFLKHTILFEMQQNAATHDNQI